jgi:hypothetical protein
MLEPAVYNATENFFRTKPQHHSWITQNFPEVFAAVGLNLRVSSLRELVPYIESMQDGRFEIFQKTLGGGLTKEREALLLDNLQTIVRIQALFSPVTQIAPLEASLAGLCWTEILRAAVPNAKVFFELGPGPAYGSSILGKRAELYYAAEVTQPYYLLQNLMLRAAFDELNELADPASAWPSGSLLRYFNGQRMDNVAVIHGSTALERAPSNGISSNRAVHIPWWEISNLQQIIPDASVDVVIANACLNEIHLNSLHFYAEQSFRVLRPGGVLFFMCPGLKHDGRNLHDILKAAGLTPVFAGVGDVNLHDGGRGFLPLVTGFYAKPAQIQDSVATERLSAIADGSWLIKLREQNDETIKEVSRTDLLHSLEARLTRNGSAWRF